MEKITLVVPTYKDLHYLRLCLESFANSVYKHDVLVAVSYDNLRSDETVTYLGENRIRYLLRHRQASDVNAAINEAVRQSDTEYVLVAMADMVFPKNWDAWLVDWPLRPNIVLSGQVVEPGNEGVSPYYIEKDFGRTNADFREEEFSDWYLGNYQIDLINSFQVRPGIGIPFIIQRDLWLDAGGFDLRYEGASTSETDLFYRLALRGDIQLLRYMPFLVYHFQGGTDKKCRDATAWAAAGRERFFAKWGFQHTYQLGGVPKFPGGYTAGMRSLA